MGEVVRHPANPDRIEYRPDGTPAGFIGPSAVDVYRAAVLASSMRLYAQTGIRPTRGVGPQRMLQMAAQYTGRTWKRTQMAAAAEAVSTWVEERKAVLAVEQGS